MWFCCRQPDAVVSQAYPGMQRCVLALLHLSQALSLLHMGIVWCDSGEVRFKEQGREIRIGRIQIRIRIVYW